MLLQGEAQIQCSECGCTVYVPGTDLDVQAVGGSERSMGPETAYLGSAQYACPVCNNQIAAVYEAYEYPVGVFNHVETEITGGTLLHGFVDIDVAFEEAMYSFDEDIALYLPAEKKIITELELGTAQLIQEVSKRPELVRDIGSREFEELIAFVFSKHGFSTQLTNRTRDGGRDIIALWSELDIPIKVIVECKRYSAANPISVDLVRNLYGVQMQEGANKSVLATTSRFTPDAQKFADALNTTQWGMDLKDFDDVIRWIQNAVRS